jgi:hypothetical protein
VSEEKKQSASRGGKAVLSEGEDADAEEEAAEDDAEAVGAEGGCERGRATMVS